jgi:hypothetical protein
MFMKGIKEEGENKGKNRILNKENQRGNLK